MKHTYSPVALPGCCFICRGAQREAYIDTEVSYDYEGAFYICNLCVNEMAHIFSYISHDEYKDLRASKEQLESINYELIKRVGALEESLRALANAGYYVRDGGTVVIAGGYSPEKSQRGEEELGTGEGTFIESVDDEDVAGLRSSESDSDFSLDL